MADILFMIHGMFCGAWVWDNYRHFWGDKGYRCIPVTLRYHDINPDDAPDPRLGTTSLLDYAADLEKEIRRLDDAPILVGHSMGALLAQMLISRGLGKAAILLTPAPPAGIVALQPSVIKSFGGPLSRWGFWKKPMRLSFKAAASTVLNRMPPEQQKEVYPRFVYESGRAGTQIGFWFLDPVRAAEVDESEISCPILVVGCTQDKITPVSIVKKVAAKYETVSDYIEFTDHAHWVLAEPGWQDIAEYVDHWIKTKQL